MGRQVSLIIKDTHRGLLYVDGVFRYVMPAGRYQIPGQPSWLATFFGVKSPRVEVTLVDVRGRDRTVVVQELLTADGATISASFVVGFRVGDPKAAIHHVKSFEDRLYGEAQTSARRLLRGMSLEEVLGSRDEIGEELFRLVRESASLYGLEVTAVDFKDLIVSEKLRNLMNEAVLAKRLRHLQAAEGLSIAEDDLAEVDSLIAPLEEEGGELEAEDEAELIIAKAYFGRERPVDRDREARA